MARRVVSVDEVDAYSDSDKHPPKTGWEHYPSAFDKLRRPYRWTRISTTFSDESTEVEYLVMRNRSWSPHLKRIAAIIFGVVAAIGILFASFFIGTSLAKADTTYDPITQYDTEFTYLGDNQWTVTPLGEQFALHNIGSKQAWLCNTNNVGGDIKPCVKGQAYTTNGETENIPNGTRSCVYIQGDSPAWDTVPNDPTKSVCAIDEPKPTPEPTPVKPDVITRTKVTIDCKGGDKNLVITDYYTTDWTYNGTEWVKDKEVWSHKTKAPATAEQCPVEPTPVDPTPTPTTPVAPEPTTPSPSSSTSTISKVPTTTKTSTKDSTSSTTTAQEESAPTKELAKTGSQLNGMAIFGLGASLVGGGLMVARKIHRL